MNAALNVAILGYGFATKTFHAPLVADVPGLRLATFSRIQGPGFRDQDVMVVPVHASTRRFSLTPVP